MALDVHRQADDPLITSRAVLLQRFHYDPIQVATQKIGILGRLALASSRHQREFLLRQNRQTGRGTLRCLLANGAKDFINGGAPQRGGIEWLFAREQLIKQNSQRVNVTARVNIQAAQARLFGTHVSRGADELVKSSEKRFVRQRSRRRGFSNAEINNLGNRLPVLFGDENV